MMLTVETGTGDRLNDKVAFVSAAGSGRAGWDERAYRG
jgi:hypothetical protein